MSTFSACPSCGYHASGGLFGGVYIWLHKCRNKGHWFCERCKNGDLCPKCGTDSVYWKADQAFKS
ncbi:MAG: hypothetical protein FJZ01_19455 [Candidatus Sericytochromatia bacterium]|nr:hypothetical protein [Candidatus Tanganyikabacteria bacterium]